MVQKQYIIIECSPEEKKTIIDASKIMTIGHSTFARIYAIEKARNILKENKLDQKEGSN